VPQQKLSITVTQNPLGVTFAFIGEQERYGALWLRARPGKNPTSGNMNTAVMSLLVALETMEHPEFTPVIRSREFDSMVLNNEMYDT